MGEHAAHPLGRGAPLFLGRFSGVGYLGHDLRIPAWFHISKTLSRVKVRVENGRKRGAPGFRQSALWRGAKTATAVPSRKRSFVFLSLETGVRIPVAVLRAPERNDRPRGGLFRSQGQGGPSSASGVELQYLHRARERARVAAIAFAFGTLIFAGAQRDGAHDQGRGDLADEIFEFVTRLPQGIAMISEPSVSVDPEWPVRGGLFQYFAFVVPPPLRRSPRLAEAGFDDDDSRFDQPVALEPNEIDLTPLPPSPRPV